MRGRGMDIDISEREQTGHSFLAVRLIRHEMHRSRRQDLGLLLQYLSLSDIYSMIMREHEL